MDIKFNWRERFISKKKYLDGWVNVYTEREGSTIYMCELTKIPKKFSHSFQTEFSVNVWLGVLSDLIGIHFLPPQLNLEHFLVFLEEDFPNHLEDLKDGVHTFLEGWLGVCLGRQSRDTSLTKNQLYDRRTLQI